MSVPAFRLRPVTHEDLPAFYQHQCDPGAVRLAGLSPRPRHVFDMHYAKALANPMNVMLTLEVDGVPAGHFAAFPRDGRHEVGYWLARAYWGRGLLTRAFPLFLAGITTRPLHALTAAHNTASIRALERAGFVHESDVAEFGGERSLGSPGVVMRLD